MAKGNALVLEPLHPDMTLWDWRFKHLVELGFHLPDAQMLAERVDIVHHARRLIESGCDPTTAARILI